MSSDLQTLANSYMISVDPNPSLTAAISELIVKNECTFLQFIQLLGKYLTEDSDTIRTKAIKFVCDLLELLPKDKLTLKECHFLMEFLINRLDDDYKNSVPGVESVIRMKNFKSTDLIPALLEKLEQGYEPRTMLAKERYSVFKVLSELLEKYTTYLLTINDQLIKTFIKVSTGEKDPRNLLISFDVNYKISTTFEISNFAEDLFDNSFCYFPISFKPPANDPYKITSESLKSALRKVLSCNSRFAKDCIPNLIEKLTSTSSMVKLDSLYTLIDCIENYSTDTIKEYSISIWNSLKYEVLHNELLNVQSYQDLEKNYTNSNIEEDHVVPVTLTLFQKLFTKLTASEGGEVTEEFMTVDLIIDELLKSIKPLDGKQAKQATLVLSYLASTGVSNFNLLFEKVFPILFGESNIPIPLQRLLITYLTFFFDSYRNLNAPGKGCVITNYKDDIIARLSKYLMSSSQSEVSLRCLCIKSLTKATELPLFLDTQEINLVVQYFTDILLSDDNPTTSKEVLQSLTDISASFPNSILDMTIPRLLLILPDDEVDGAISDVQTVNSKNKVLGILSLIVENKQLLDVLLVRLLNKIYTLSSKPNTTTYMIEIFGTMVNMLKKTLDKAVDNDKSLNFDDYLRKFVPQLLVIIIESSSINKNDILLEYASKLIKMIIVNTNATQHQNVVDSAYNIFIDGAESDDLLSKSLTQPIKLLESPNELITLFVKILSAVDRTTTKLPVSMDEHLSKLIEVCQLDSLLKSPYIRLGFLQTLSLVVNKYMKSSDYLSEKLKEITGSYEKGSVDLQFYKNLEILTWITKALILKDDPIAEKYESYVIDFLSSDNAKVLEVASKSIEVLIAECELFHPYSKSVTVFGKTKKVVSNIDIRLLYKQKFFNFMIPELVNSFNDAESQTSKKNYLITLSLVLKYVDDLIMKSHIEQVFPLILKSLFFDELQNAQVVKSSLNILIMSLSQHSNLVKENLKTLIPRLLELANSARGSDDIKLSCLSCLIQVGNAVSIVTLMDYKEGVIRNLGYTLDDRKRSVRKLAADCRQMFYDLGQSKE